MTDDNELLELAGRATPGPWHHVNAFRSVPASMTVHGRVPAERVDYVSTWPDIGTPPGHRVVIPQPERGCGVRSEDMAYIAASCNEVPRLISEKREAQARADALLAENERLKEALKPFAATGAVLDGKPKDDAVWAGQTPAPPITFGHLRNAAAALNKDPDQ